MARKIIKRHMSGGKKHEHISSVQWLEDDSGLGPQISTRETIINWIDSGGKAYVVDADGSKVNVEVVNATPRYIRTKADGKWTDNLLDLPEY